MDINEIANKLLTRLAKDEVDAALRANGYTDNRIEAAVFVELTQNLSRIGTGYYRNSAKYEITFYNEDSGRYENGLVWVRWDADAESFKAEF